MLARLAILPCTVVLALAANRLPAQPAVAGTSPALRPGDTVSVVFTSRWRSEWWEGALERADGDSLVLRLCGRRGRCMPAAVPATAITRLDVQRGRGVRPARVLLGAVAGLATGALAGALVGYSECGGEDYCFAPLLYGVAGAAAGIPVGMLVGAAMPGRRWVRVRGYPRGR